MGSSTPLSIAATVTNSCLDNVHRLRYKFNICRTAGLVEAVRYDPLRLHWVSPDVLTREIPGRGFRKMHTPGVVVGGDWDLHTIDFHGKHFVGLQQRFIEGRRWEDTVLYRDAIGRSPGNYYHGCRTENEVAAWLNQYDVVYDSMARNGYLSQRRLIARARSKGRNSVTLFPVELNEVVVHIGRDGDYIFDDGRHRLSIAKILRIKEIPVLVVARHRIWYAANRISQRSGSKP